MLQRLINNRYLVALFIFVVNFIFKAYHAGQTGLSYDENFSAYFAQDNMEGIIQLSRTDPNPPLYLLILHCWIDLFGDSEYALRILSVLANSFAAALFFLFCLRFFNWQTGIFASLMFLFSNEIYYYSEEARTYSIILALTVASFYCFLALLEQPKLLTCFLLGMVNASLIYLHYVTGFILFIQLLLWPFFAIKTSKNDTLDPNRELILLGIPKSKQVISSDLSWFFAPFFIPGWIGSRSFFLVEGRASGWQNPVIASLRTAFTNSLTIKPCSTCTWLFSPRSCS